MLRHIRYITIVILLAGFWVSCEKNNIECETDAECEQMLVGLWEETDNCFMCPAPNRRLKFKSNGIWISYGRTSDSVGNTIWIKSYPNDTFYYNVENMKVIVRYATGKYQDSVWSKDKIIELTRNKLDFKANKEYKRIK